MMMIGTTVTSFSPQTTQWYRKTHKSEDYRHYCDEFRLKNDTAVVTWRSTAVVGWSWQTNTIPFPYRILPRSENPDCFAFPSPKKELGKQFYITVMSSDRRESRHPFNKLH